MLLFVVRPLPNQKDFNVWVAALRGRPLRVADHHIAVCYRHPATLPLLRHRSLRFAQTLRFYLPFALPLHDNPQRRGNGEGTHRRSAIMGTQFLFRCLLRACCVLEGGEKGASGVHWCHFPVFLPICIYYCYVG